MTSLKQFPPAYRYSSLSVKDLIEARDVYHWHLLHLSNVIATAIGLYRIREDDWYADHPPGTKPPQGYTKPSYPRTTFNSVVRSWSFPCILVFVREWVDIKEFAESPDQMVPRALFLPNGKAVPTCTILAEETDVVPDQHPSLSFPKNFIGGGYLLSTFEQATEQFGSVGCLVTDGKLVYAMTSQHLTGEAKTDVFAEFSDGRERVGESAKLQLGKIPFSTAYPEWESEYTMLNADVGLVKVDDVNRWTTQIWGENNLSTPIDLTTQTLTLDLIECPVSAFGGMSGKLKGKIVGLFYRYKSVGGKDYVSDFLITPRTLEDNSTLHGDSGTLWCLEETDATQKVADNNSTSVNYRPLAVQWGGHSIVDGDGNQKRAHNFALATNLSTICRELDVDVLRSWNSGLPQYWGSVGHYTIAAKAIDAIPDQKLKDFMKSNLESISYDPDTIDKNTGTGLSKAEFVPLADVPDMVWKMHQWDDGGRNPGKKDKEDDPTLENHRENPNHFADMDAEATKDLVFNGQNYSTKGKTLLDICQDSSLVNVEFWKIYYADVDDSGKGTLPFRVQQLYVGMVEAVKNNKLDEFLVIAGVLAHYVGDACQPLHISRMHDGDPDHMVNMLVYDRKKKEWKEQDQPYGAGVHSAYEDSMVEYHIGDILQGLANGLVNSSQLPTIDQNNSAAVVTVKLMQQVFNTLPPKTIVDAFAPLLTGDPPKKPNGSVPKSIADQLWNKSQIGERTIEVMLMGCQYLAHLWQSAWTEGLQQLGANLDIPNGPFDPGSIKDLYYRQDLVPSVTIEEIGDYLQ